MEKRIHYKNSTAGQKQFIGERINNDVLASQTELIKALIALDVYGFHDSNIYRPDTETELHYILEWLAIDRYAARRLHDVGETTLENEYGYWWGRTCSGQSIVHDPTFWNMYQDSVITFDQADTTV